VNLAYIIGVMLGDGGVYGNYYTVFCRDPNLEFVEFIARTVEELFGIKPNVRRASTKYYLVSTNVRWVHDFFLRIGFPKGRKLTNASIPPLYRNDLDVVKGLFDSEGYCGIDYQRHGEKTYAYPYVGIDMIARPVIMQAMDLLSQHGIQCSHQRKTPRAWGKHYQWRLVVKGWENVKLFSELIGFRHPEKSRRLLEILTEGGILRDHTPRAPAGTTEGCQLG
jgi:hypothetical protein